MIGSMRQASLGDGMFDNQGTEQFQDMADGKTADAMSGHNVLHIADMLMKQLGPIAAKSNGTAAAAQAGTDAAQAPDVTRLATAKASGAAS
jgi:peptidoglycan hydrolase FlgJ